MLSQYLKNILTHIFISYTLFQNTHVNYFELKVIIDFEEEEEEDGDKSHFTNVTSDTCQVISRLPLQ